VRSDKDREEEHWGRGDGRERTGTKSARGGGEFYVRSVVAGWRRVLTRGNWGVKLSFPVVR